MNNINKTGGISAIFMALAYITGLTIYIAILNYPGITTTAEKIDLIIRQYTMLTITNLILYIFFGIALVGFLTALYTHMKNSNNSLLVPGIILGLIWAGSLVASGMVANAGNSMLVSTIASDPTAAVSGWLATDAVATGLGNGNGEILGGVMTLLISAAGLSTQSSPKGLHIFGIVVGIIGVVSVLPALNALGIIFGITQIVWFIWWGVKLLRSRISPL